MELLGQLQKLVWACALPPAVGQPRDPRRAALARFKAMVMPPPSAPEAGRPETLLPSRLKVELSKLNAGATAAARFQSTFRPSL